MSSASRDKFDLVIGRLDRDISELMLAAKDPTTDDADWQTLKHHAEDIVAAGERVLTLYRERKERLGSTLESPPSGQPLVERLRPIAIVESPFAGDVERNLRYLRAALRDCLLRGEAPFASHALYTQPGVLDDNEPGERALGIEAGFAFRRAATKTVVYGDLGVSRGMQLGIDHAKKIGHVIEMRSLPGWAENNEAPPGGGEGR
jgi:hypothetical protein